MRITGGLLKGRSVVFPGGRMEIRPAMDMMRESVFNIIAPRLAGSSFLDLFSGSGTIAIEAASRGACAVELCEMDKSKAKVILQNVAMTESLGLTVRCHFMAVELFLKRCKKQFDFIFFDPPFPYKYRRSLLETVERRQLLAPSGEAIIHYPQESPLPGQIGSLSRHDLRVYGRSLVGFYRAERSQVPSGAPGQP
ncbi:MAG: 16S rRNA (guanine(966)-N(2))-methyltransferase RsmD [Treponema sp.]|nr:16S rRNA (guanine(966)-N(2))-methyltransferase RsmD [Treponema sp.]